MCTTFCHTGLLIMMKKQITQITLFAYVNLVMLSMIENIAGLKKWGEFVLWRGFHQQLKQ
jgi:hypothetical protein